MVKRAKRRSLSRAEKKMPMEVRSKAISGLFVEIL
jgi:hypothetical protein